MRLTCRVINKAWLKYCPLWGFPQIALPQIVIKSGVFTKLTLRQFANVNVGVGLLNPFPVEYLNSFFAVRGRRQESTFISLITYNVKQSQQLTEEVSVGPPVVVLQIVVQIVQEQLLLLLLLDLADHPHVEVHHERGDLARLPVLPQPAGNVEQYRLRQDGIIIRVSRKKWSTEEKREFVKGRLIKEVFLGLKNFKPI